MKRSLLSAAAVGCLLGFYLVAVGGVGALAYVAVRTVSDTGPGPAAAIVVALLGLAILAGSVISSTLRRPLPESAGLLLERVNHPDLWDEVAEIAERVGTRAPDEIRLTPTPSITVSEDAGRLGLIGGTRRLGIGVPLLLTLTRSEVHAVLAHELAHWRRGPLGLSAIAYRGQLTMGGLAARQRGRSALGLLLTRCAAIYQRVALEVNREQEIEADEASARIAGSGPAIAALRQVPAVELLWERYEADYAYAAVGRRPHRLFEGFEELWGDERVQAGLVAVRDEPVERTHTPYDAHPATAERLDRLAELASTVPVDNTPADRMIKRSGWHALELEKSMFRANRLEPATWDEIADAAGRRQIHERATTMPDRLDQCIVELAPGPARVLTRDLLPEGASQADVRTAAVELVTAAIESALLERGDARIVSCWAATWRLVDEAGKSLDIAAEVAGAYRDDALRDGLLEFVRSEGLADYRVRAPAEPVSRFLAGSTA